MRPEPSYSRPGIFGITDQEALGGSLDIPSSSFRPSYSTCTGTKCWSMAATTVVSGYPELERLTDQLFGPHRSGIREFVAWAR